MPSIDASQVALDERGRIVLPAKLRSELGWQQGEKLILTKNADGSLKVVSLLAQIGKFKGLFKDKTGKSLAAELIKERRREAARE